jgi:hypothetical protein
MILITAVAATALTSCSDTIAPANNVAEAAATALQPGEYGLTAKVDELRSTDNTTPATALKVGGAPKTSRTCVGPDNAIEPSAFVEAGETCTPSDSYMRNGRMNLQYRCNRSGKGQLTHVVDGSFKGDSFTAQVRTGTYFSGSGDYDLMRSIEAKRVGECAAKAG